ncbi:MAG: hypothetical protein ACOH10_03200 [Rhodoglobus sp.]
MTPDDVEESAAVIVPEKTSPASGVTIPYTAARPAGGTGAALADSGATPIEPIALAITIDSAAASALIVRLTETLRE